MQNILISLPLAVILTGCTHPIKLAGAKTAKGIINTNGAQYGHVHLWDRDRHSTSFKSQIVTGLFRQTTRTNPRSDQIGFTRNVSLTSETKFSAEDQATLEGEATTRSTLEIKTKNYTSFGFLDPLNALTSSINADAENWYAALEFDPDNNQFEHENGIFVVVVSWVTEGDETKLVLDRTFSGDTTLKSKILSGVFGN